MRVVKLKGYEKFGFIASSTQMQHSGLRFVPMKTLC
ncbi:GNAT family N-acetyltransferase [Acinetobacter gyllenbergii]